MIPLDRVSLTEKIHDYQNLEKYLNLSKTMVINDSGTNVVPNIFSVVLNHFACSELARMMPVCKKFFLLSREIFQVRLKDLIAEKQLLQKQLEALVKIEDARLSESYSIYSGPTGC